MLATTYRTVALPLPPSQVDAQRHTLEFILQMLVNTWPTEMLCAVTSLPYLIDADRFSSKLRALSAHISLHTDRSDWQKQ